MKSQRRVDVSMPHKRKRRLKNYSILLKMQESDPNSTNILETGMMDTYYPQRPTELEMVCLYDFIKWYEYRGGDEIGNRMYTKVSKARLPNHKLFDPTSEHQREEFYYSLMLLFVPFRDESALIHDNESAEAAFNRYMGDNADLCAHHGKLQLMLQAQSKVKEINEAREMQDPPGSNVEEDIYVRGEPKDALD